MRILLVEDHPDSRWVMVVLLRSLGHDVIAAGSVDEAIKSCDEGRYDCAMVDLHLPDGSGLDLFRDLSTKQPLIGLALTGSDGFEVADACRSAGFRYHLVKPLSFDHLKRVLSELTEELGSSARIP